MQRAAVHSHPWLDASALVLQFPDHRVPFLVRVIKVTKDQQGHWGSKSCSALPCSDLRWLTLPLWALGRSSSNRNNTAVFTETHEKGLI